MQDMRKTYTEDKQKILVEEVVNPIALGILEGKDKRVTAYSDTRYSDGNHTDWLQKK